MPCCVPAVLLQGRWQPDHLLSLPGLPSRPEWLPQGAAATAFSAKPAAHHNRIKASPAAQHNWIKASPAAAPTPAAAIIEPAVSGSFRVTSWLAVCSVSLVVDRPSLVRPCLGASTFAVRMLRFACDPPLGVRLADVQLIAVVPQGQEPLCTGPL